MSIELVLIPIGIAVAQSIGNKFEKQKGENNTFKVSTVMKKEDLLEKALNQYGCKIKELNENNYQAQIGDTMIYFQPNNEGVFEAVFDNSIDSEAAFEFIENLTSEYKYVIQQETYKKLLVEATNKGLTLESEEIQQDRSILLTFNLN